MNRDDARRVLEQLAKLFASGAQRKAFALAARDPKNRPAMLGHLASVRAMRPFLANEEGSEKELAQCDRMIADFEAALGDIRA